MGTWGHCCLATVLGCPELGCVCWARAASSALSGQGTLATAPWPGRDNWDFRAGRSGHSPRLWSQAPFKRFEPGFPYSAERLELSPIKDEQWLVIPVMSHFLCFSHNGLIGNKTFQGKHFPLSSVWQAHLKFSSNLRNSPKSSQIFWYNSTTEM